MNDKTEPSTGKDLRSKDMRSTRKRWLAIAGGVFVAIGVAWGAYWMLALRYAESTDDAYVSGNIVQITPQIAGTVVKIAADDTQFVKAGSTLVELDPADAKLTLEAADAKLARTVRDVRGLFATTAQLRASLDMRSADVARATEDLNRRQRLASSGAVSGEELQHARDALTSAQELRADMNFRRNKSLNQGVSEFDLPERAFSRIQSDGEIRLGHRATIRGRYVNNLRLQYEWSNAESASASDARTIRVLDAFTIGGAQISGGRRSRDFRAPVRFPVRC